MRELCAQSFACIPGCLHRTACPLRRLHDNETRPLFILNRCLSCSLSSWPKARVALATPILAEFLAFPAGAQIFPTQTIRGHAELGHLPGPLRDCLPEEAVWRAPTIDKGAKSGENTHLSALGFVDKLERERPGSVLKLCCCEHLAQRAQSRWRIGQGQSGRLLRGKLVGLAWVVIVVVRASIWSVGGQLRLQELCIYLPLAGLGRTMWCHWKGLALAPSACTCAPAEGRALQVGSLHVLRSVHLVPRHASDTTINASSPTLTCKQA